jgi:hypothetical protein
VEHVLGPGMFTELITEGTAVNIGGRLQVDEGYHAPRFLRRKIYLHLYDLKDTNLYFETFF